MTVRYDDREQIEAAQIAANEEAIGQACSRILGVPERITPEQITRIRADDRAVVANTTDGGSGEDFATLAAWLIPALDEVERLRRKAAKQDAEIKRLRGALSHTIDLWEADSIALHRTALPPSPAREEGVTTDGNNGD